MKGKGGEGGFLAGMKESLEGALAPLAALRSNLGEMVELVAAAFVVEKIADWVNETTEAAEKLEQMAAKIGVTVAQAQELSAITKLAGGDIEEMTASWKSCNFRSPRRRPRAARPPRR